MQFSSHKQIMWKFYSFQNLFNGDFLLYAGNKYGSTFTEELQNSGVFHHYNHNVQVEAMYPLRKIVV